MIFSTSSAENPGLICSVSRNAFSRLERALLHSAEKCSFSISTRKELSTGRRTSRKTDGACISSILLVVYKLPSLLLQSIEVKTVFDLCSVLVSSTHRTVSSIVPLTLFVPFLFIVDEEHNTVLVESDSADACAKLWIGGFDNCNESFESLLQS